MKSIVISLALALFSVPAIAAAQTHGEHAHHQQTVALHTVESQYVCMVTNQAFDKPQLAIPVGGKTYYGCCPMCKKRLEQNASLRMATDPVSSEQVDKAVAVIGATQTGAVYYFKSVENMWKYDGQPSGKDHDTHDEGAHEHTDGAKH